MLKKTGLLAASAALWMGGAMASAQQASPTTKGPPNIVFVLIDDMGYADLGCFDPQAAPTPNIDRVAKEGLKFTQYYTSSPICSPSRTALLTGQYPQRWKITSFIEARNANERRGMAQFLDLSAPSVARALKSAGYATGHFGKWHMGGGRDVGEAPLITEYGFDESLTQFEGLGDRLLGLFDKHDGSTPERSGLNIDSEKLGRGKVEWVDRSEITSLFADRALAFIDKAAKEKKPFYVNVWPDDVHSPFFPPKALRNDESKRALYRSVVEAMDQQFAKLFDRLRNDPALRDNTILVITSDNGPEPGAGLAGEFRGTKGFLWEGGIREPFIVWAPGLMDAKAVGTTNEVSVIAGMDLPASFVELADAKSDQKLDGVNFASTLLGKEKKIRETPIFWRRPPDRPGPPSDPAPDLAMRDVDWKLLCTSEGSTPRLFDLKADPGESKNLADEHADRVKSMTKAVMDWNATLPKDNAARPRPNRRSDNNG